MEKIFDIQLKLIQSYLNKSDLLLPEISQEESRIFLRQCRQHQISQVIYQAFKNMKLEGQWLWIYDQLKTYFNRRTLRSLDQSRELLRLLALFTAEDIRVIPYKGPVLSEIMHDKVNMRQSSDLDILIAPQDLDPVVQILKKEGYISQKIVSKWYMPFFKHINCEYNFDFYGADGHRKYHVEPHWQLGITRFQLMLKLDDMSPFLIRKRFLNTEIDQFSIEGHFITLLIHHSNRVSWQCLKYVVDIAIMIQKYGNVMNWESLYRFGYQFKIAELITFAVYYSHQLLGIPIPKYLEDHIPLTPKIQKAISRTIKINKRFQGQLNGGVSALEAMFFHFQVRRSFIDKVKMFYYHIARAFIGDAKERHPSRYIPPQ